MAIFFFDEKFQFYHFIGSILVIIGLVLANKKLNMSKINKSKLTSEQKLVLLEEGTEPPGSSN